MARSPLPASARRARAGPWRGACGARHGAGGSDIPRACRSRWRRGRARVPPRRETALRVGVDERHRPGAGTVRLDREMTREGGLAGPALLGCDGDNVHFDSPGEPDSVEVEVTRESWNRVELTLG